MEFIVSCGLFQVLLFSLLLVFVFHKCMKINLVLFRLQIYSEKMWLQLTVISLHEERYAGNIIIEKKNVAASEVFHILFCILSSVKYSWISLLLDSCEYTALLDITKIRYHSRSYMKWNLSFSIYCFRRIKQCLTLFFLQGKLGHHPMPKIIY